VVAKGGAGKIPFVVISGEYDDPPEFLMGQTPIFPAQLMFADIRSGSATLTFSITPEGCAVHPEVVAATHPQFAAGIAHVMPSWRFKPAVLKDQPVAVRAKIGMNCVKY
jgi:hypothetical protein